MRRDLLLLLTFLFSAATAHLQPIDSMERVLRKNDMKVTDRIKLLNQLARDISFINPIKSVDFGQEALRLSQQENDMLGKAYAYRNLGSAYSNFGSFYLTMDNLQKARDLFTDMNDSAGIASCYISLGHIYRKLKNRPEELKNNRLAFEIFSRLGIPERIGVTAHNLGETYFYTGAYQLSLSLTQKAIVINDSIHNLAVLSSCYKVMGKIYAERGRLDSAEIFFGKVLEISEALGEKSQKIATIESMIGMANVYDRQGFHEKELKMIIRAVDFVRTNNLPDYVENVYTQLIREYLVRNMNEKALAIMAEFKTTKEQINAQQLLEKDKMTAGFIQLFEIEKKNNQLEKENQLQEARVKLRNRIVVIVSAFMLILVILLIMLFRNIRKLRSSYDKLLYQETVIRDQNKRLEELNANKDKFFSVVSHDIKAPLNSLWSFSNILTNQLDKLSRDQLSRLSQELNRQVETTTKMVDNLITWARLQMKNAEAVPEKISVAEVVYEVSGLYQDIALSKQIELSIDTCYDCNIWADKNHTAFIIRNLVNNAIKYTPKGGVVHIRAEKENTDRIKITVRDSGNGFDHTVLDKLFSAEPVQSRNGTAGEPGTGLGLRLCYEFARLNHTEITVENEAGKGALFTVFFPSHPPVKESGSPV